MSETSDAKPRLDESADCGWLDDGDLSASEKMALDAALVEYEKNPGNGSPWEEDRARIQAKLRS